MAPEVVMADGHLRTNGVDVHFVEAGKGPLVVLCHGFPELAYSWRHQMPALANAGYHVVAPDQRGYGQTSKPADIAAYNIMELSDDLLGLIDVMGAQRAMIVGHDWGSPVVWHTALRAPERVAGVVGMSVPYLPRPHKPPTEIWNDLFVDTWFYMLYFQAPGVADEDLGRDPETTLRRMFSVVSGDRTQGAGLLVQPRDGRGMVERLPEPGSLPAWLSPAEFDHYVDVFTRTGFTGGLNWYRNFDLNWALTAEFADAHVAVPAAFVAGAADPVLLMAPADVMRSYCADLRGFTIVQGAGHWIQQEAPAEANAALLEFAGGLDFGG